MFSTLLDWWADRYSLNLMSFWLETKLVASELFFRWRQPWLGYYLSDGEIAQDLSVLDVASGQCRFLVVDVDMVTDPAPVGGHGIDYLGAHLHLTIAGRRWGRRRNTFVERAWRRAYRLALYSMAFKLKSSSKFLVERMRGFQMTEIEMANENKNNIEYIFLKSLFTI